MEATEAADKAKILIVDDEESMRDSCNQVLSKEGYVGLGFAARLVSSENGADLDEGLPNRDQVARVEKLSHGQSWRSPGFHPATSGHPVRVERTAQ